MKICYNGKIIEEREMHIPVANRAFRYGDGLFETMHWFHNNLLFFEDHIDRITAGMKALRMIPPRDFTAARLEPLLRRLIEENQAGTHARLRLQVWRNEGGLYIPDDNTVSWYAEASPVSDPVYFNSAESIRLEIYDEYLKMVAPSAPFKTLSTQVYMMAGIYSREVGCDDCLLLNNHGKVIEAIAANVFFMYGADVVTPPVSDGCVTGVMRKNLMELLLMHDYRVFESSIGIDEVLEAEECFLTNVMQGVRSVAACGIKNFQTSQTHQIRRLLMESLEF